jgi:Ran GTPase-activating protein (RanGAP) involved in mRNA processing and transport
MKVQTEILYAIGEGATDSEVRILAAALTHIGGRKTLRKNVAAVLDDSNIVTFGIADYVQRRYIVADQREPEWHMMATQLPPGSTRLQFVSPRAFTGKQMRDVAATAVRDLCCLGRIEDSGIKKLAIALDRDALPSLRELNLQWCHIGSSGITSLVDAICRQGSRLRLEVLDLGINKLRADGVCILAERLDSDAFRLLKTLDLAKNAMEDRGATALAASLGRPETVPSLRELSIRANLIGTPGAVALAKAFSRENVLRKLKTLHLQNNRAGPEGIAAIVAAIGRVGAFTSLQNVDISGNKFGDTGILVLAEALRRKGAFSSLRSLRTADNDISDTGVAALANVLGCPGVVPTLRTLDLAGNQIWGPGAIAIAVALCRPGALLSLQSLYLLYNHIGNKGAAALTKTLNTKGAVPSLQRVQVFSGTIDHEVMQKLRNAIDRRRTPEV